MGFYTDLDLDINIATAIPDHMLLDLYAMVVGDTEHVPAYNTHELYDAESWLRMFGCYQERKADNKLIRDASLSLRRYVGIEQASWYLHVRSCFKHYAGEVQKFLDWISPYVIPTTRKVGHALTEHLSYSGIAWDMQMHCLTRLPLIEIDDASNLPE